MAKVKFIGEKVSYKHEKEGASTIVISSKISPAKETLLAMWIAAWTFCGAIFIWQLFVPHTQQEKVILLGMVVFWLYFEWRIVRTYMFRKFGMEFIKFEAGQMTYKRAIKTYGKARTYFLDNLSDVEVVEKSDLSWSKNLESSFWVMGGERVQMDYMGRKLRVGMQIDDDDAAGLAKILNKFIEDYKSRPEIEMDEESVADTESDSTNP